MLGVDDFKVLLVDASRHEHRVAGGRRIDRFLDGRELLGDLSGRGEGGFGQRTGDDGGDHEGDNAHGKEAPAEVGDSSMASGLIRVLAPPSRGFLPTEWEVSGIRC
jgi:hypothetical protein